MYVLEQYLKNVSSVGWTNATQPSDICVFVMWTKVVVKCQSQVQIETPYGREMRPHSPSLGHPCPGAGLS